MIAQSRFAVRKLEKHARFVEQIRNDSRGKRMANGTGHASFDRGNFQGNWPGKVKCRKTGEERKLNAQPIVIDDRCRFAEPWMIPGSNQSDVLGQKSLRVNGPNSGDRIGPVAPAVNYSSAFYLRLWFTLWLFICETALPARNFPFVQSNWISLSTSTLLFSLFLFPCLCSACSSIQMEDCFSPSLVRMATRVYFREVYRYS